MAPLLQLHNHRPVRVDGQAYLLERKQIHEGIGEHLYVVIKKPIYDEEA